MRKTYSKKRGATILSIDIYKECPVYQAGHVTLRLIREDDAYDLLRCYCDDRAAVYFNTDYSHEKTFCFHTLERMKAAIYYWLFAYEKRWFVRFSIVANRTGEKIGTVEMNNRREEEIFSDAGLLRIDLQSQFEQTDYLDEILDIATRNFYQDFGVNILLTKVVPEAVLRIQSLLKQEFVPVFEKRFGEHYYQKYQA